MATEKSKTSSPVIMEWRPEDRGDNLVIKLGKRIYSVDKFGTLISQRYKKAEVAGLSDGTFSTPIEGLADLKVGYTYTISNTDMVVGKLMESNLFGYRFLSVNPEGSVSIVDMDYEDAIRHCQEENIRLVRKVCD